MASLIIDLSNNNAGQHPNFKVLHSHGIRAVWLKVSQGHGFTDPFYAPWRKAAISVGMSVGAYHFADLQDPVAEANHFCTVVGKLRSGDLLPALDVETGNPRVAEAFSRSFNARVKDRLGRYPLFYSNSGYIAQMPNLKRPIGAGLWLANYSRDDGREHPFTVPAPWHKTVAHQFSSRCTVVGCSGLVDLSTTTNLAALTVR